MKWICLFLFSSLFAGDIAALKENVYRTLPTLQGWCSNEKASAFIDLVMEEEPDICVEIGTFGGSSALPVASALKFQGHGKLIAIDPWDRNECIKYYDPIVDAIHLNWWNNLNLLSIYYSYLHMLKKHELENFVITLRNTSEMASSSVEKIDILYLDGNPSEKISSLDVTLYLPKVKSGGYIWLNDALGINRQNAIDLLLEECEIIRTIETGNCLLFRKK